MNKSIVMMSNNNMCWNWSCL